MMVTYGKTNTPASLERILRSKGKRREHRSRIGVLLWVLPAVLSGEGVFQCRIYHHYVTG